MTFTTIPIEKRFLSKIEKTDGCWNWIGGRTKNGYGVFFIKKHTSGRFEFKGAHCYSYVYHKGDYDKGLEIDHLCKNPSCVNPDHLEAVTSLENHRRSDNPAGRNFRKTKCLRGHVFDEENTYYDPAGKGRSCKKCRLANVMAYDARKRKSR